MDYRLYLRLLIILFLCCIAGITLDAQVRPGIKFGLSTPDVHPKDFIVTDDQGDQYYRVFVEKAKYGIHGGAFIQIQLGGFFMQPEVLFNSTKFQYRIDSISVRKAFTDTYRNIDFPLILGLKTGPVRLGGGPVGHLFLDSDSGFGAYPGFEPLEEKLTWGWQAGLGLDFWKLHIDIRYEGNFSKLGDQITFFGKEFDFATNNNRLIGSLGFSF